MSDYIFHHIGLPTNKIKKGETFNEKFSFYAQGYFESYYGIEWLRFTENSDFPELLKNVPHIAFVVDNIIDAIKGKVVLIEPNSPAEGVTICFIIEDGAPVEFLQFDRLPNLEN